MMIREAKSEAQTFFLLSQPLNYFILKFVYAPAEEAAAAFLQPEPMKEPEPIAFF